MDGLAIPEEKRGHPNSQRGWQARLSTSFAYASLVCSLSLWLMLALYYLQSGLHFKVPLWLWLSLPTAMQWVLFEAFALLLAMIATGFGIFFSVKLWRIALPAALLTFFFVYYAMVS